jgi:arylsulfatase A-like enzyme
MNLKRCVFALVALLLWATSLPAQPASPAPATGAGASANSPARHAAILRRTSIIYLACHGLALGDLSCYGQTNFQTPNLDRLAAGGVRCTDYRAVGDDLSQEQAALMTGSRATVASGQSTLAARLRLAGYHTGLIGEWTLGPAPWTQGFDEFAGFLNEREADNYYSDFIWRYAPKSVFDPTNHTFVAWSGREEIHDNTGGRQGKFIPDVLMGAMVNFVRVNAPDFANRYRPFFLLVNLPAPHSVTPGKDDYPVPTDAPFTSESWPQAAKNRAALLTRLDDGVGRLLEQLKKVSLTNNIAIFLAGAAAPERFADTNLNFLQVKGEVRGGDSPERLRQPMLVYWPEQAPAGHVSRAPWSAPDFAPTALEIAFVKPAASFTGVSVLPALLGHAGASAPTSPDRRSEP